MIKYIFCDVDDTLFANNQPICKENILAIKRARERGVKIFFNSGRLFGGIEWLYDVFGIEKTADEYAIGGNGSAIFRANGEFIENRVLSSEDVLIIGEVFREYRMVNHSFVGNSEHLQIADLGDGDLSLRRDPISYVDFVKEAPRRSFTKAFFYAGSKQEAEMVVKEVEERSHGRVGHTASGGGQTELIIRGVSKGNGLLRLVELLRLDIKECACIGDSYNDVSMMEVVPFRACPSNGEDEVREMVDYVSPLSANQGAVSDILAYIESRGL